MVSADKVTGDFSGECDDGSETFSLRSPLELEAGVESLLSSCFLDDEHRLIH